MDFKRATLDWEAWKRFLGQTVEFAGELGISRDRIVAFARQAGDLLAENVPPATPEQKTLKELWAVADENEKQALANLMTKLVSTNQGSYTTF
ncbi:MAG: DUF3243 domain-containing protein [Armatimonadetes bacterium]|nr:DUF3243 domain-containing protein [Armatimonadota bacterium]